MQKCFTGHAESHDTGSMQEIEMLAHAVSIPEAERSKPLPPPPTDLLGELHMAAANLGKQRQQIAADVFKPSHRLPTRSLREQACSSHLQMKRGLFLGELMEY